ncbi:TPA_exp: RanBP1 domain protein [Trichophyton benhamiae CBS 112371]|nr:TPA_exp: RanBP1 domain protein [Trichophyton benhamiae CBS 112371]
MSSNDAPKRATAAQIANRKIKAARERRTRVGSPSLPQPAANPFSSVGTDTTSSSAFTAPSNGFTFGQSQGFSRPATATGTSNNIPSASSSFDNNQSNTPGTFKLFGSQTTSAPPSFDFSSNNAQQVSNPFSNMSSNQNTGFQGFKGSMFNIPGASQPENKKPENQQNGTSGFFGQPPAQTSAPLFGATPTTSAPLFNSSAGPNMFGQSNNNNPPTNIFGSATMPSPTKSTGGGEAMQMSPDGPKSTAGQAMFNVSAPAPPIFKPAFSSPSTGSGSIFNLGGTPATTSAATPAFSFNPTASAPAPPASSGSSTLFGASKPEESKAAPAVSSGNFMFGASASTPTSTPLFGQQKPTEAPQATTTAAAPATTASTTQPPSIFGANPSFSTAPSGGSLFSHLAQPNNSAASASAANGTSSIFSNLGQPKPDATPSPTKETSSLFGNLAQPKTDAAPAPAKETGSIFGHLAQPKAETVTSPAKESPPLFSAPSTSKPLFGAASTTTAQPTTQPAFSFFGQTTKPAESPKLATATTGGQTPSIFATPSSNSIFQAQQQPTATQTENKTPTQSAPMFAASTNIPPVTQPKPMFTNSVNAGTSGASKPLSPTFGAAPVPAPAAPAEAPAPPKPRYVDASTETVFEASVTMVNFRPTEAEYPPNATPEVREQFLRLWRLSALNASFQEEIASVNCWSQDLDPIIGRYVMLRKLIGHPHPIVTQYIPATPGSKLPCKPLPPFSDYDAEYERERAQAAAKTSVSNADAAPSGPPGVSHKRKASDAGEEECTSSDKAGKRTKFGANKENDSGDKTDEAGEATPSKTLSLFANSFVAQKSRVSAADGDDEADAEADADGASSEESEESDEEEESTDAEKQEEKTTTPSVSPPSTSNGGGRSLFDRVQRDENGQPIRQVQADELHEEAKSLANEANELASSVMGGSRTGSPFNAGSLTPLTGSTNDLDSTRSPSPIDPPKAKTSTPSIFANLAPSGSSNIFGASNSFTSTSSAGGSKPTTTSNIFGAPPSSASGSAAGGSAPATSIFAAPSPTSTPPPSNIFGAPPSTSAPAPTSIFATPSSAPTPTSNSSLAPPTTNIFGHLKPGNSSAQPGLSPFPLSAATSVDPSPAQSDTDATNDPSDEVEKHAQVDFTRSGPGEEDEDAVFECRSRAYQHINGQWEVKGLGVLRILKHRTNKKSRILLRADPSGSVVLNTNLMPEIDYKQNGTGVQFIVASESGFQHWLLRVKTAEGACELRNSMEEHKKRD